MAGVSVEIQEDLGQSVTALEIQPMESVERLGVDPFSGKKTYTLILKQPFALLKKASG